MIRLDLKRMHRLLPFLTLLFATSALTAGTPASTRFQAEFERFAALDTAAMPPTGAVLCIGSSTMRLWGDRLADDLAPLTVIPRGFGGSMFSDVIDRFDALVPRYQPRAILIYEGDNDINNGKSPAKVLRDFLTFRVMVQDYDPTIRLYVMAAKPSLARWHLQAEYQQLNTLLAAVCAHDPQLIFIDIWTPLIGQDGQPRQSDLVDDRLHLSEEGYDRLASAVAPLMTAGEARFETQSPAIQSP